MTNIFHYEFMQRAFTVGLLLGLIIPCIGVIVVFKRLSMIGDALSHNSLAGVAVGLILGVNPVLSAISACIIAALGIEAIRKKIPQYAEMSIAIVMSTGIALAGVFSGFVKKTADFNSFLFGSIVAIDNFEAGLVIAVSCAVLLTFLILYKELFFIAFDERAARLAGIPVKTVNFIFTLLTAVTVAVASRTIGALIVSSMMVVPVACAMQIARSYSQTVIFSMGFGAIFTSAGLFMSYYAGLRPGSAIVLSGIVCLCFIIIVKLVIRSMGRDINAKHKTKNRDTGILEK